VYSHTIFKEQFSVFEDYTIAVNLIKYHQYSEFINLGSTAYKLPIYPLFVSVFVYLFNSEALRYAASAIRFIFLSACIDVQNHEIF
jgi:hypothetical protein